MTGHVTAKKITAADIFDLHSQFERLGGAGTKEGAKLCLELEKNIWEAPCNVQGKVANYFHTLWTNGIMGEGALDATLYAAAAGMRAPLPNSPEEKALINHHKQYAEKLGL